MGPAGHPELVPESLTGKTMMDTPQQADRSMPFVFDTSQIRGRIVRMDETLTTILSRHDYPVIVSTLLGELTVLVGLLAGALKNEGVFSLQIRGDGPIGMMVADCTNDGEVRAYARFDQDALKDDMSLQELVGDAFLSLNLTQTEGESYQGIVELEGPSLTSAMLVYFKRSEQIDTGIDLHIAKGDGQLRAGGIIVQRMPEDRNADVLSSDTIDDWRRTMMLLNTLTKEELTDPALPSEHLLYRLFNEEQVRVFEALELRFGCRCSEERLRSVITNLPHEDQTDMLDDEGMISANCQFCNETYQIDPDNLKPTA